MNLFKKDSFEKNTATYVASYEVKMLEAMDEVLFRKIIDNLSEQVAKQLLPYVTKNIDKSLVVEQVSAQVSKKVLEGIFSPNQSTQERK